ncbi:yippee zinc-binding/DNA-binding /Mis18, centromere assembly-domain-containing protein [Poronia punctata]|nr:yippee zinc-binding/DNA-binding /Mis18, centromere assembly-domain-containing protein [Poronia punctata]
MFSIFMAEAAPPRPPRRWSGRNSSTADQPLRFPSYLIPGRLSTRFLQRRRRPSPSASDVPPLSNSPTETMASTEDDYATTGLVPHEENRSSAENTKPGLARFRPTTIRCAQCGTDFAFCSQIMSKSFTGHYGRAYLVSPPASPSLGVSEEEKGDRNLINIEVGASMLRILTTGAHVVADISCAVCRLKIGWKYTDAKEEAQKYKIGKFILETQRTREYNGWEEGPNHIPDLEWEGGDDEQEEEDAVVFDSDDESECDDIFAGVWNAKTAAQRRERRGKKLEQRRAKTD